MLKNLGQREHFLRWTIISQGDSGFFQLNGMVGKKQPVALQLAVYINQFKKLRGSFRNHYHCWTQQTAIELIAFLEHGEHGIGFMLVAWLASHRLM